MNDNANVCVVLLAPPDLEAFFFAPGLRLACEITEFTHAESVQAHAGACALRS